MDKPAGIFRPRPIDQTIEFFQFAAFALPANVFLLGFTPGPLPVKKEETLTTIPLIEGFKACDRSPEQVFVLFTMFLFRIRVIRKKAEEQIILFIREV
ncbi:MAG: hypothetical protein ACK2T2_07470, partial [Anaerolineales bacterium]